MSKIITYRNKFENKTEYYINRPCEATWDKCNYCDLQAECHKMFDNGKTCPIINEAEVWMEVTDLEFIIH